MKTSGANKSEAGPSASERIDARIRELDDWRGKTLASLRKTILDSDPEIIEEWKWMGSPVWSRDGMIAVGNAHKDKVKLTFSHGASLPGWGSGARPGAPLSYCGWMTTRASADDSSRRAVRVEGGDRRGT